MTATRPATRSRQTARPRCPESPTWREGIALQDDYATRRGAWSAGNRGERRRRRRGPFRAGRSWRRPGGAGRRRERTRRARLIFEDPLPIRHRGPKLLVLSGKVIVFERRPLARAVHALDPVLARHSVERTVGDGIRIRRAQMTFRGAGIFDQI